LAYQSSARRRPSRSTSLSFSAPDHRGSLESKSPSTHDHSHWPGRKCVWYTSYADMHLYARCQSHSGLVWSTPDHSGPPWGRASEAATNSTPTLYGRLRITVSLPGVGLAKLHGSLFPPCTPALYGETQANRGSPWGRASWCGMSAGAFAPSSLPPPRTASTHTYSDQYLHTA
jgi:hypothetical protein